MTQTATKVQKQVQVIARVEIKKSDLVVYKVRSSNGTDTYQTTFYRGKFSGCTCPSRKPCYHGIELQKREDARLIARVDTMIAQAQAKITEKQNELGSCDTCGYQVKQGVVTCARCLGY